MVGTVRCDWPYGCFYGTVDSWRFFGGSDISADPRDAWDIAFLAIAQATDAKPVAIRDVLDKVVAAWLAMTATRRYSVRITRDITESTTVEVWAESPKPPRARPWINSPTWTPPNGPSMTAPGMMAIPMSPASIRSIEAGQTREASPGPIILYKRGSLLLRNGLFWTRANL
jgi:hypothetical protein